MGYGIGAKTEIKRGDNGIDGLIYTDELHLKDRIYIQAKRYKDGSSVSPKDVKEFLYNVAESNCNGVLLTTGKFSDKARQAAESYIRQGKVALIDSNELVRLCLKYKHGFKVLKTVEILEPDFEEE